jgi:hypothetical protein
MGRSYSGYWIRRIEQYRSSYLQLAQGFTPNDADVSCRVDGLVVGCFAGRSLTSAAPRAQYNYDLTRARES